jgi:hypothetical protein
LLLAAASGCATLDPLAQRRASGDPGVQECARWFRMLDSAVDAAGVRDAQSTRLRGFPYLRVDRFSAALRETAQGGNSEWLAFSERLLGLDADARRHEIANLPSEVLQAARAGLADAGAAAALLQTRECGSRLLAHDLQSPDATRALMDAADVPDDYVTAYRVLGLYELTKIPFSAGIRKHEEETAAAFARDLESGARGTVVRFSPATRPRIGAGDVRWILERALQNPLRIPMPSEEELETLFALYAPSFEIDTVGDYDRPGALRWRWGDVPEVEAADPAVYKHAAYTRYKGRNLLQLVYTLWFPERPAQSSNDLLAGKLDGVVFRVTLSHDGTPLVYDTMHPCGCYHMFFTTPRAVALPQPPGQTEWALIPQKLRAIGPTDRLVVRIASATHYVERVYRDQDDSLARYELRPYDELRSLRQMRGNTRSIFGPDGIIAGTERGERFLFWPMGIANAGAMRQWGRHATAFVGRRHFDDADLLERRFELDLR